MTYTDTDVQQLNAALGIETPEEEIARRKAEAERLRTEKLEWKRLALRDGDRVLPSWIAEQREQGWPDMHPEAYCHKCGVRNVSWAYDGDWQEATAAWAAETGREGICCMACFLEMHAATTGKRHSWVLKVCDCGCKPSEVTA